MDDSRLITLLAFTIFITACAPFNMSDKRAGVCNQLNSKMVFSGGTSNTRQAELQRAEEPLVQRSYDKTCDQPSKLPPLP